MRPKTRFAAARVAALAASAWTAGSACAQPLASPPGNAAVQANASSEELGAASQLGAQAVRAIPNLSWLGIERVVGGGYDWSGPDANHRLVQSHGFEYYRVINDGDGVFATIDFKGQTLSRSQVSTLYAQNISYTKALIAAIRRPRETFRAALTRPARRPAIVAAV